MSFVAGNQDTNGQDRLQIRRGCTYEMNVFATIQRNAKYRSQYCFLNQCSNAVSHALTLLWRKEGESRKGFDGEEHREADPAYAERAGRERTPLQMLEKVRHLHKRCTEFPDAQMVHRPAPDLRA
jgi:hypothetical protein